MVREARSVGVKRVYFGPVGLAAAEDLVEVVVVEEAEVEYESSSRSSRVSSEAVGAGLASELVSDSSAVAVLDAESEDD